MITTSGIGKSPFTTYFLFHCEKEFGLHGWLTSHHPHAIYWIIIDYIRLEFLTTLRYSNKIKRFIVINVYWCKTKRTKNKLQNTTKLRYKVKSNYDTDPSKCNGNKNIKGNQSLAFSIYKGRHTTALRRRNAKIGVVARRKNWSVPPQIPAVDVSSTFSIVSLIWCNV